MNARKTFGLVFLVVIGVRGAQAQSHGFPTGETGRMPATDKPSVLVEMKNDSYSFQSDTDWDDFRTFGFFVGFSIGKFLFGATLDSLTNRSYSKETASRIDELYVTAGREILGARFEPFSGIAFSASLSANAAVMYLGNLGMADVQKFAHGIYGSVRPFPWNYDEPAQTYTFIANPVLALSAELPITTIEGNASFEAGTGGFMRVLAQGSIAVFRDSPEARIFAGFRRTWNGDRYGSTFTETLIKEEGPYVGMTFRAGFFETGFTSSIMSARQNGYVAITVPGTWKPVEPRTDTGIGDINEKKNDHVRMIEYLVLPLQASFRLQESIIRFPVSLSPFVGGDSGPGTRIEPAKEHYTYTQVYAGIEIAQTIFTVFDVYVAGGAGIRRDQRRTCIATTSRIISEKVSPRYFAETGLRVFLPWKFDRTTDWGVALSAGLENYETYWAGTTYYTRVALVGAGGR
jgi:hypothetical protein